jgi:hypothetical protein
MHKNKLHYDVQTRQVKIAGIEGDQIVAIKEQVLPALASTVVTAKYKGKRNLTYISLPAFLHPKTQCYLACQPLSQWTKTIIAK